jgi:outer membrane protein assembly factor BamE
MSSRLPLAIFGIVCALMVALGLGGCVHRIPIQQGNFLEREDLDRVAIGMTRVQVRALLGTPMISDPFHQERWDYYYYFQMGRWKSPQRRQFTVYFDNEDKVARVEEPIITPTSPTPNPEIENLPTEKTAVTAN